MRVSKVVFFYNFFQYFHICAIFCFMNSCRFMDGSAIYFYLLLAACCLLNAINIVKIS